MDIFGIGALELLTILIVALLVMGPDHMPGLARRVGNLLNQARRSVAEAREALLRDLEEDKGTDG